MNDGYYYECNTCCYGTTGERNADKHEAETGHRGTETYE